MIPDVLILGGGLAGLSSAFRLASAGAQVTLLEKNTVGAEATWAGGGILSPLMPWDYADAVNQLCHHSAQNYAAWVDDIRIHSAIDPELWVCGMQVNLPTSLKPEPSWLRQHANTYPDFTTTQHNQAGLWLPKIAQIRNPRLIKSLKSALVKLGVNILEHSGTATLQHATDMPRIAHISSQHGVHKARDYLICGGAWSQQILTHTPPAKAIAPVKGQMLLFQAETDMLTHIIYQQGTYIIPRQDGHILVGSTVEHTAFDKSTTPEAKQQLMQQALQMLPALQTAQLMQHWSGLRPGSPSNIPTIAQHPNIHNLFINAGHFRYGVTMAATSSQIISDLIQRQTPSVHFELAPYKWNTPAEFFTE